MATSCWLASVHPACQRHTSAALALSWWRCSKMTEVCRTIMTNWKTSTTTSTLSETKSITTTTLLVVCPGHCAAVTDSSQENHCLAIGVTILISLEEGPVRRILWTTLSVVRRETKSTRTFRTFGLETPRRMNLPGTSNSSSCAKIRGAFPDWSEPAFPWGPTFSSSSAQKRWVIICYCY